MAEPKLRFKRDAGSSYPPLECGVMGDYFTERNEPGDASLPFLTVSIHSGISDGELDEESLGKRINRIADPAQNKKAAAGDLVFNMMRAWQGAVGCAKSAGMVSPAYIVASPDSRIDPNYMDLYVKTKSIIDQFNRLSYGAIDFRKRLYWDSFVDTRVFLPCLEEQKKIADFLSSVDEVISSSEQEVANLETQKKAVMKKIFSQEVRFKRDDETEFPEWEETTFGEIGAPYKNSIVDGPFGSNLKTQDYTESGVLVFQSNYITSGSFSIDKPFYVSKKKAEDLKRCSAKSGDILIAKIGARFGMCDIIPPNIEGILSSNSMKIDLDSRVALNAFYKFYLRYLYDTKYHYREIGITAQPALSLSYIRELVVPLPSLEEQRQIADFLSTFDEAIVAAKRELALWKELKKALLQQMFV